MTATVFPFVHWLGRPWVLLAGAALASCLTGLSGLVLHHSLAAAPSLSTERPVAKLPAPEAGSRQRLSEPVSGKAVVVQQAESVLASSSDPALPFRPDFAGPDERARSLECLTSAIYYEAGEESEAGQHAVAQVVLNRVRHVAYPNSVCGVVYQGSERSTGCQFTFTCDGSLARRPSTAGWTRAREVAESALAGEVFAPVGYSTHYHADYVLPYWSPHLLKTAVIGSHIFYRSRGAAGHRSAFTARYAGPEPRNAPLQETRNEEEQIEFLSSVSRSAPSERLPEERAEALDEFGLLNYRAKEGRAPAREAGHDAMIEAAMRSAESNGRVIALSSPSARLTSP